MIKKPFNRFVEYINDHSINLKDRMFVLFSALVLCALFAAIPCGIIMREPASATVSTLAGAVFFFVYATYSYRKNKIATARIVISVILVFIFFPAMFFTNGGARGGAPVWLLLGCLYVVMVLEGRSQMIMSFFNVLVLIICWIVGYFFPDLVTEYSRGGDYFDNIAALIIVSNIFVVMINFQNELFHRETELADEKTKEVEEMNRAQNRFFSSMSHEIRTPINTVLGLNEIILRQEDASDEIKKDARNIQGAGKLLLALINDILDVSKIEAGKMDIVPVNYDVASLISEIVNMIWLKAEEKGLKFHVEIDPNVPASLFGDEVRIKQILINLLNNAVKYTKEGSVDLHIECEAVDASMHEETQEAVSADSDVLLKIAVSDTGMGIKPEALPHLFDTFKRVDEEKNRHIEGTGLGLSIVKQLIELMGGEITVNSVYNEGSTFAVTLRQKVSSEKRIGDISITSAGYSGGEKYEHAFTAHDARILIVDDNEMNLRVEKKLLEGTQIQVDEALSGQDALSMTLRNRYDVIFMDHLMPEMDGIECFEKIRTQKGGLNPDVPVIVLTANAGAENMELYHNAGFNGYLVKPVSGRQLEEMLMQHLPAGKIEGGGTGEMKGSTMNISNRYAKKKPVVIATSTMSDLPVRILNKLQVSVIPYTVITSEGVFYDDVDIDSEELVRYMADKKKMVDSEPPTEEALTEFFASELKRAHQLIYITLTTGSSREYGWAMNAAKAFDNVTVVNSECLSSATGILVMVAARLAQQGLPARKIVEELEETKKRIRCSFVVKSTDIMARRNRISPLMNGLLNSLWLRPVLRMKNDRLGVGKFLFGSEKRCYEKYIRYALPANVYPDKSFVFLTYAGMTEEELVWVEEKITERVKFDNIVFQKASAGISSNCGEGTFGIIYLVKGNHNYGLASIFPKEGGPAGEREDAGEEGDEEVRTPVQESAPEDMQEDKWYKAVSGIDHTAAIRNSGSEESFLSVLQIFHDTFDARSEEIQRYYDSRDWENYTVKVHALKSSARLVGALALGDEAEALEKAGGEGSIDFITGNHGKMMERYRAIRDELAPHLGRKEDAPDIPADMLADAYASLAEFAGSMDFELAKMVIDSVREYKLSQDDEKRFDRISAMLSRLDWDGIKETIQKV